MRADDEHPLAVLDRWLADAALSGEPAPTECVLATASRGGSPSARMVRVKGITSRGLTFTTRSGTRKVQDLLDNPRCCFVFWWPNVNRQVRAACHVEELDRKEASELFSSRPIEYQVATIVSPQGAEIADLDGLRDASQRMLEAARGTHVSCPEVFLGYIAISYVVEFWTQGSARIHERVEYRYLDGEWHSRLLAP